MSTIKRSNDGNVTFFAPYVAYIKALGPMAEDKAKAILTEVRKGKGRPSEADQIRLDQARIALNLGPKDNLHPETPKATGSTGTRSKFLLVKTLKACPAGATLVVNIEADGKGQVVDILVAAPAPVAEPIKTEVANAAEKVETPNPEPEKSVSETQGETQGADSTESDTAEIPAEIGTRDAQDTGELARALLDRLAHKTA